MVDQQTMERVIEAGKNQPIGIIAIVIVVATEALPFLTGARIDTDQIKRMETTIVSIAKETGKISLINGKLDVITTQHREDEDETTKTNTAHRDIERTLAGIRGDVTRALRDIGKVRDIVTSNAHLFDILDMRLNQINPSQRHIYPGLSLGATPNGNRVSP